MHLQRSSWQGYKLNFSGRITGSIPKEDRPFDRFKGRVMFPLLRTCRVGVLGFGGHATNDKKAAKYLNSPEIEISTRVKVLYEFIKPNKP
jgi:DNA primase